VYEQPPADIPLKADASVSENHGTVEPVKAAVDDHSLIDAISSGVASETVHEPNPATERPLRSKPSIENIQEPTNDAEDGPRDTDVASGRNLKYTVESTEDEISRSGPRPGACQMAFADWLLPICRQSKQVVGDFIATKEEKVYALVQSMMQ
jgi:hypothetical protein